MGFKSKAHELTKTMKKLSLKLLKTIKHLILVENFTLFIFKKSIYILVFHGVLRTVYWHF